MKSTRFSINWKDMAKALLLAFLSAFITALAQALGLEGGAVHWPTAAEWLNCLKVGLGAALAYLVKNYFTDDIAQAKSVLKQN